jgi:hypothetical protein
MNEYKKGMGQRIGGQIYQLWKNVSVIFYFDIICASHTSPKAKASTKPKSWKSPHLPTLGAKVTR